MAYATKYLFKWQSANGTTREIRVLKDGYSGTVIQRHLGRAPVLKKQHNGNVYGTSLEFFAECAVDGEFAEFYTSDPKAYRADLYAGSTLLWQGYITPELYSEPDIAPPYDVQVIATDGIGELKLYDFEPRGIVTLRALLTYLLGHTGLGTDVYLISSIKPGGTGAAGSLLSKTINVDYKAGDTCYEVLSYLLDTLHATITWWKGAWILARETNVTFQNGKVKYFNTSGTAAQLTGSVVALGKMRANDAWPVGQLSTVIDPAKKSVTVQAPWHPVTAFTNSGMTSDTGWTKSNNAAYASAKSAYSLPDNGATVNLAAVSQNISMAGIRVPMAFSGKFCASTAPGSGQIYGGVAGVVVEYATGGTTYHLGKDEESNAVWVSGAAGSTNYDFQVRLQAVDTDELNAESLEFDIPAFALGSTYPSGTLTFRIVGRAAYVFSAYLDVILPRGYQDRLHLDNGARGEGGDVEIAIGRETTDISYYMAFLQGLLLDSGALITSFKDDYITDSGLDYLSFIARDYARSLALPRLKRTGTVFLESAVAFPPLVFTKGSVDYWLEGYSWDMYEDELEISARSLPTATITVDSEVISEASGTVSSSGSYGASSSIGGGGGVNYFQLNGTLSSLVELKDQYTYLGPKGGLFFSGATLSGTPTPDLYVDTVNNQRVLRSPLPLITGGDQIVIDGTPGGGGGGGSATLAGLDDVSLSGTPTQGQYLAVGSNGKWTNVPAPSGGGSVNSIVVGTTPYSPVDGVVTLPAYAPYSHTHTASQITDLSTTLAGYVLKDGDTMSGNLTWTGAATPVIRMQSDTSNYKGLAWANTSDESIAGIGYHNTAQAIYINAIGASSVYSDAAGKYSLKVGNDVLTYNTKVILREDNYATYLDTAYLPLAGGKNITGNFSMSAGVMVFINSTSGNALLGTDNSSNGLFGVYNTTTYIRSGSYDLFHKKFSGSTPTDYKIWDGSNSGTTSKAWEASTLLAATRATVGSSTLDTDNVLSVTGTAKITGALALGNSSSANLNFQRGGANYITAPSGGSIYFIPDGGATQLANSPLIVGASSIYAGKTNTDLGTSTYYWRYAYISRVYLAGGAYLEYNSNGYIYISKPIVTEGDQIVISGTPGGGGGGTIPYLYELQDVTITNIGTGNLLQWNGSAWVNVAASSVGVTSVATQSANGLMSSTDKTKLDGIATGANNYTLPAATSGALGGIKIGYTDSTAGTRNYAVQLSNDKAYVNVPWDNTTYSLLTSSANGLAPAFSTANKATSASTNSYYFLGWTGSTMKWYSLPANAFSDTTYSAATQSAAGLMSSADKTKLDGIATGATAVTDSTVSGWGYLKTDEKVKQTATTTSAAYEILFSESANNTTATEGARKTSTLTYNPSTKALSTGGAVNGLTLTAATTGFTIAGGTTSKTLTVNETGTAVLLTATQALTNKTYNGYTLRDACAKGYTDSTSASAIGTDTALVTERDVYYGLPTINNAHNYTSSTTIYAPTGAGTSGYWLKASGSNTAPTWEATSNMEAGKVTTAADTTNALYVVGVTSGATSTLKRDTSVTITGGAVSATSLTLAGAISGATNIDSLIYCDTTNSRVGIGQSSPTQALDVNGNAYIKGFVRLANNNNINIMTANGAYAAQMVGFDSSNINHLCYGGSGGVYETRIYGNVIKFYNNSRTQVASISTAGLLTTSGDQVVSSDASLKKDWRPLNYGISDIAKATAGVFTWKDGRGISAGTKAQDWEHLVPQLVHGDEGHKTLAYGQVAMLNTILLARGYESHEERIKRLEARVAELELENEQLRAN